MCLPSRDPRHVSYCQSSSNSTANRLEVEAYLEIQTGWHYRLLSKLKELKQIVFGILTASPKADREFTPSH